MAVNSETKSASEKKIPRNDEKVKDGNFV
jgi:hypothetical protein